MRPACRRPICWWPTLPTRASLAKVAESAKVVITTVGPYVLYGEPLVAACAAAGTDYVDLTGEPEFVDRMWLGYHERAQRSGARLVHCCGFDSIPHDLGAYFTVKQLPEGVPLTVNGYVRIGARSSPVARSPRRSTRFGRARQTLSAARAAAPGRAAAGGPQDPLGAAPACAATPSWAAGWCRCRPSTAPIVRRSAAALERYGPDFTLRPQRRRQAPRLGRRDRRSASARRCAAAQLPPTRKLLLKAALARRGAERGDAREELVQGHLRRRGRRQARRHRGLRRRPGYGETAKMLAESGLCLAFDELPRDRRPGDDRRRRWATPCWRACRLRGSTFACSSRRRCRRAARALNWRLEVPRGCSSAGRASRWQREGQGFEPPQLHCSNRRPRSCR